VTTSRRRSATPDRRGPARWLFDVWSFFYDQPLVQRLTYRPVQDAVMRELRRRTPARILDLGCGTGILAARIVRAIPGTTVAGCDFSPGMLRHAAARSHRPGWVCGDAQRLPFRSESFDAIACTEAFHWFPDQPAALRECLRVLRPGGCLLVALVNVPFDAVGATIAFASRFVGQPFTWPTRARMRALVEGAGLRLEGQQRIARLPAGVLLPPVLTVAVRPVGALGRTAARLAPWRSP
jgi:ubiquinone/menaquinone biosynthesis C-methylase UbiE